MHPTLVTVAWQASSDSLVRKMVLVVAGSLLLAISAKVQVPFYPVPMTMQTLVVLSFGMAFGWRLGGATVLLYLLEGMAGFPVFAGTPEKGIGLSYMLGGTGGYLAGYLVAALAVGVLAERGWDRNFWSAAAALAVGNILIYAFGLFWLGALFGWDKPILQWGLYPFIYGDLLKTAIAAVAFHTMWRAIAPRHQKGS